MYTQTDLTEAREVLQSWQEKFERYSGNNPNKYQADIKSARRNVRLIENALKASGQIPFTEQEQLEKDLDATFPNAESKQIVEFRGRRYRRKFWPLEKSRSGKNVTEWGRCWENVT